MMKLFRNLSIKNKLIVIISSIASISMITGLIYILIYDISNFKTEMKEEISVIAEVVGDYSVPDLLFESSKGADETLKKLSSVNIIKYACIFDENGAVFASYAKEGFENFNSIPAEASSEFKNDFLYLYKKIESENIEYGTIFILTSTSELNTQIREHLVTIISSFLLIIVVSIFIAAKLQGLFSDPIIKLTDTVQEISNNDNYSIRVKKSSNDEIGLLYDGFNDMLHQIEKRELERDAAAIALRESEEKFKSLVSNIPGIVYRCDNDRDWTMHYMSEETKNITGYNASDFVDNKVLSFASIIHPEDADLIYNAAQESLNNKKEYNINYRIINKSGEIRWVLDRGVGNFNRNDNITHLDGVILDITKQKEAELERTRLSSILESTTDLVSSSSPDGDILYMNRAGREMLGWPLEGNFGERKIPNVHPKNIMKIIREEGIPEAIDKGVWRGETAVIGGEGNVIPVSQIIMSHKNNFGDVVYLSTIMRDVSESKANEAALIEAESKFRSLVEQSLVGIYIIQEGSFKYVNPKLAEIFGYTIKEILEEMPVSELVAEEDRDIVANNIKKRISHEIEAIQYSFNGKRKDGSIITVEVHGVRSIYRNKPAVIGTLLDISERKTSEEEMRRLRNLLSNIVNSMPSVLVGVDSNGYVNQWNKQAEKLTGMEESNAQGQPVEKVFPQLKEQMEKVRLAIKNHETQRDTKIAKQTNSGTKYEDITVYPLEANGVEGAVIRIDDVTERVQLEEMMIQSEKMLSVGGLAAGMAHEINNPLAGIIQNTSVVINRLSGNLPANEIAAEEVGTTMNSIKSFMDKRGILKMLLNVSKSGSRAAKIVKNMLSFARISDTSYTKQDIKLLLDSTIELVENDYDLKKRYDFRKIEIVKEYDSSVPKVSCEGTKIQQVFLNLLKNGAQAMAEVKRGEGESSRFILRINQDQDNVVIEIEDNGPGMNENTRKRIFEPFFTTKKKSSGTGLGLSVSYFIVTENHKGTMTLDSAPERGSKFTIRLPIGRDE